MHGFRGNRVPGLGLQRVLALARPGGALEAAPSTAASGERRHPGLGRRRRAAAVGGSPRAALAELAPGYPVARIMHEHTRTLTPTLSLGEGEGQGEGARTTRNAH